MIESIKITSLNNIGSNLSFTSVFPVVDINGTPITNKANLQIIGNYILSQAGGANFVQAAQATLAQSVTNAAQPNITSVGTLSSLTVNGNLTVAVSNLKVSGGTNGYVLQTDGAGNLTWTAQTGGGGGNGSPGGSNSQVQFNDAGSFGGDSGLTYNKTTDTLTAININAGNVDLTGNVNANWVIGDYVSGNAHNLFYIPGANVNGAVPSATTAGTVTTAAQPNITSIGTLSSLGVTGNANVGNLNANSKITATTANIGNLAFTQSSITSDQGNGFINFNTNGSNFIAIGSNDTSNVVVAVNKANGGPSWTFTNDGLLVFPESHLYIDSSYNYFGTDTTLLQTAQDVPFLMLADGSNSSLSSVWLANAGNAGNSRIAAIYANPTHDSGLVRIVTGNNGSNTYIWDFDDTGNVTLPGNTFAVKYANGTSVPLGGGNVSQLTNVDESFALDADGNVVFDGPGPGGVNRGLVWNYGVGQSGLNSEVRQDNDGLTVRAWTENGGGANGYSAPVRIVTNQSGNEKQWRFDGEGNLTMPGNLIMATGNIESATISPAFNSAITNITTGTTIVVVTLADNVFSNPYSGTVAISSVVGTTEANGTWGYQAIEANEFQLYTDATLTTPVDGTTWTAYVSGGDAVGASDYTSLTVQGGNVTVSSNDKDWVFNTNGAVIFPTLTVDIHNGGNQQAQTLQFGDPTQQAIITGPTPAVDTAAQRLIIQGQRGTGLGEGGDVYLWGGDSNINGGDIKIYAGDADVSGYGGYINLDAGSGVDGGGQLTLTGGYSSGGQGGQITITPGYSGNANGALLSLNGGQASGDGGNVNITAGYGGANGGQVTITGGQSAIGLPGYGNVVIQSGASSWTFDNGGNLLLAGGNSKVQSLANSSLDPLNPNVSTMVLTPDQNYGSQALVLDPTAPGHIHLRAVAYSNADQPAANLFLGGEESSFEVGYYTGTAPNVFIHSNNYTWTFDTIGNLSAPGNINFINGSNALLAYGANNYINLNNDGGMDLSCNTEVKITTNYGDAPNRAYSYFYSNGTFSTGSIASSGNVSLTGNLIFSSNVYVNNGFTLSILDDIGGQVDYSNRTMGYAADNNGTASLYARDSAGLGNNNAVVTANGTNGTVLIRAANAALSNKDWTFDGSGNLTLPGNTFAINYANGTQVSLGGSSISNGNSNVSIATANGNVTIAAVGNSVVTITGTGANITGTANISGNANVGNLGVAAVVATANISTTGYFISGNQATGGFQLGNSNSRLKSGDSNSYMTMGQNPSIFPDTAASASAGVLIGGSGYILGNNGSRCITLNYGGSGGVVGLNSNVQVGTAGSGTVLVPGTVTTGVNSILAGPTFTPLANTMAGFVSNVNSYTQLTIQNKSTGADATVDFVATADNGSDTVNYLDMGIINSGYDNATPTNSLGNIVFAADSYMYAQGNTSNASQSGGNLAIGTTVPGKNVKIFAGGVDNTAIVANIANTGVSITGNLGVSGNITGNTNGFAIGYLNIPQVSASNTTLGLTDAGKHYYSTTAGNITLTIPLNSTTAFPTGTAISIVVQAAGNVLVNAASGVTLYLAGSSSAGNRVVGTYGMATLMKVATDTWFINGTGVS